MPWLFLNKPLSHTQLTGLLSKVIRRAWRSVRLAVRAVSVPYEYKQKQEHLKEEKEKNNIIVFVLNHYNYNYLR